MRIFMTIVVLAILGVVGAWIAAGRATGPVITINQPSIVGQTGQLSVTIDTPEAKLKALTVTLKQGKNETPLFSLAKQGPYHLSKASANQLTLLGPLGKKQIDSLIAGAATLHVTAVRPVLFGYRQASSSKEHGFQVRLTPPRISVVSRLHYIHQGGSEMVIYRATPPEAVSGVRVGKYEYPGYPASGAGIPTSDPALRVAFFALLWDQGVNTPIKIYARDAYGNEATTTFNYRTFPRTFKKSRIHVGDSFLKRVVPAVLANSPNFHVDDPSNLIASYIRINRVLRRLNRQTIADQAKKTAPRILWHGAFQQQPDTAVEAVYADQRDYYYNGKKIDHEVHLGYDLASIAGAGIQAANSGRVVYASSLGIFGNCVIVDHGMGVQTLYGHLSSIDVKVGQKVKKGQRLGREGQTGLAGGVHVHFTMLVNGHAVTPIEWWSPKWIQDRILRKLHEAGAPKTGG